MLRSDTLAAFVTEMPVERVPEAILAKARLHVLDTLACGLAGACSREGRTALAVLAATEPAGGAAVVWGTPATLSPRSAALVNGTACHAFELDDTGGCDHSGAVVLPALLAALPLAPGPVSGRAFLTAVVLGYDLARRVLEACGGYAPHNEAGWHSTATCGPFGAAAAVARLLGLDREATRHALGHAASFGGGVWAFIHDGAETKRIHAGRAAEGGLLAALLARGGVAGPAHVFEDCWGGFLRTVAPASASPDALTAGLGESWRMARVAIKPHAACRSAHSAIDAAGLIVDRETLRPDRIREVAVRGPAFLAEMCGGRDVGALAAAQMSLPYGVAIRIVRGGAGLDGYREAARVDPAVLDLMARVRLDIDPSLGALDHPAVTVATADGRLFAERVDDPLGSPTNPLSPSAHDAKARALCAMALPPAGIDGLFAALAALPDAEDVRVLPGRLAAERAPAAFA